MMSPPPIVGSAQLALNGREKSSTTFLVGKGRSQVSLTWTCHSARGLRLSDVRPQWSLYLWSWTRVPLSEPFQTRE